jgi:hypothetical protein
MEKKKCILHDGKWCDDCGECNMCDLNPDKICDNCGKCIDGFDYSEIRVEDILEEIEDNAENNDNK